MKAFVITIRAIGCEFIVRKLKATAMVTFFAGLGCTLIALWLTTVNAWWWFFAGLILLSDVVLAMLYLIAMAAVQLFRPYESSDQRAATAKFVDKLERITDNVQLPAYVVLFKVTREVARPRKKGFIEELTIDSKTVRRDFLSLVKHHGSLRDIARS